MAFKDLCIMIMLGLFQSFDHGSEVEQNEKGLDLVPGDHFRWECGQFDGTAQVISYVDGKLVFIKIS